MSSIKEHIVENVLICIEENRMQLCDIHFNTRITKIIPKSEQIYDWLDLNEKYQHENLKREYHHSERKHNPDIIQGDLLLAMPGAVDPHVHFNTPGFEFRDTFEEASYAAACGGVTTVIDMPCTSLPPVTAEENMKIKKEALRGRSHVDYALWGGIPGNDFSHGSVKENIFKLAEAGAAGLKVYTISGMQTFTDLTYKQIELCAEIAAETGKPIAVHAEDKDVILTYLHKHSGEENKKWQTYCAARSIAAEVIAVEKIIEIARRTNCRMHIVHLSSGEALLKIKDAAESGIPITAETCPHYLYFTQEAFERGDIRNYLKTAPPVKYAADREALWQGCRDGSISFITTDHAGCDPNKEKKSSDFSEVYGGIPGVEHRVPFMFSEGFMKGRISLEQTIKLLASNAADYFSLKNKGYLKEGFDADIALINLWSSETVSGKEMHSKGKYTPFEGVCFNAVVEKTFLRGLPVYEISSSKEKSGISCADKYYGKCIYDQEV